MLRNYFRAAIRNIRKHKSFSFLNILGLSLSMSICLLIITLILDLKSYDNFHNNKDRIYRVITKRNKRTDLNTA